MDERERAQRAGAGPGRADPGVEAAGHPDPAGSDVPDVLVVGAVVVDDLARPTRLLAARRSAPAALSGRWELPGGKIDPGETPRAALHRELREELGVTVRLGEMLPGPESRPRGWWRLSPRHVMAVWWAVVVEGEPQPLQDHDELAWLGRAELLELAWLDGDAPIVEAVRARVVEAGSQQCENKHHAQADPR